MSNLCKIKKYNGEAENRSFSRKAALFNIEQYFDGAHQLNLKAHQSLFLAGNKQAHIYQVIEGIVGRYELRADGRFQIVNFYHQGDLLGVEDAGSWQHHGRTISRSRVQCIPIDLFNRSIESDPRFNQLLVSNLTAELMEMQELLLSLRRQSAIEKVASFLLRISRHHKRVNLDCVNLYLPMLRAEIADYLGMTVETVSRTITKLKTSNIIRLNENNRIQILDFDKLEELAMSHSR